MEEKVELERLKLTNYVLQKENEILLGTIGIITRDKAKLIEELEILKNSKSYKITKKIKKVLRRK